MTINIVERHLLDPFIEESKFINYVSTTTTSGIEEHNPFYIPWKKQLEKTFSELHPIHRDEDGLLVPGIVIPTKISDNQWIFNCVVGSIVPISTFLKGSIDLDGEREWYKFCFKPGMLNNCVTKIHHRLPPMDPLIVMYRDSQYSDLINELQVFGDKHGKYPSRKIMLIKDELHE